MAAPARMICESSTLIDGGRAFRFDIVSNDRPVPCFAIRYEDTVHAYVNSCPHRGTELDWQAGEVFDESGLYLICATHGAAFDPTTGLCVSGPCAGERLSRIVVREENGQVSLDHASGAAQSS
jgi:nitrite reductase/ring-hydroxylating ferredoxin subunit